MLLSDAHLYGILRLQRVIFNLCFHPYSHTINLYVKFVAKRYLLCTCVFYDSSEFLLKSEIKLYMKFLFLTCLTIDMLFLSPIVKVILILITCFCKAMCCNSYSAFLRIFHQIFCRLYRFIVSHPGHVGSSSCFLSFRFSNRTFWSPKTIPELKVRCMASYKRSLYRSVPLRIEKKCTVLYRSQIALFFYRIAVIVYIYWNTFKFEIPSFICRNYVHRI